MGAPKFIDDGGSIEIKNPPGDDRSVDIPPDAIYAGVFIK